MVKFDECEVSNRHWDSVGTTVPALLFREEVRENQWHVQILGWW